MGYTTDRKYNNQIPKKPYKPRKARVADMQNGRIRIRAPNGRGILDFGYCDRNFDIENERGISTHIGRMHGEIRITNLLRPYFPASFKNIANLKQHILTGSCASNEHKQQPLRWDAILNKNTNGLASKQEDDEKPDYKQGISERTEIRFNRIRVPHTQEGVKWECIEDDCIYQTGGKQRIRNHLATMQGETNTGILYFPYCDKKHT